MTTHTEVFLPSTASPLPWESPSLAQNQPGCTQTMPRALRKVNPIAAPQKAGTVPTFSGDAESKQVDVRGADALTGMFCQEPALLSGDGARVLCLLFLTQRKG